MSEKIIIARCDLVCDLCGRIIPGGDKCRMYKDDFMPQMTYFEHLRCPSAPEHVRISNQPIQPVVNQCQQVLA